MSWGKTWAEWQVGKSDTTPDGHRQSADIDEGLQMLIEQGGGPTVIRHNDLQKHIRDFQRIAGSEDIKSVVAEDLGEETKWDYADPAEGQRIEEQKRIEETKEHIAAVEGAVQAGYRRNPFTGEWLPGNSHLR